MSMAIGEKVRLYIQREDGRVQEVSGNIAQLNIHQNSMVERLMGGDTYTIPTTVETEIRLVGSHYSEFIDGNFEQETTKMKTVVEWRCDHCATVNLREHRGCTACGFPRSFLYG
jgi:hypothetical protein